LTTFSSATAFTDTIEREEAIADETRFLRDLINDMWEPEKSIKFMYANNNKADVN